MTMKPLSTLVLAATALSAHALTPGSGTWVKETATYGTPNVQDAYVYVPKNTSPAVLGGKRALMLSLHGCGQKAADNVINNKYNWDTTAEQYGMVVIAPTVPTGSGATGERSASNCWDWFGTNHNRTNRDAVPLKKLVDAVKARPELDIDPNQIYVTGLSSGAGETHILGCMLPDYFAGVGTNAAPALGSKAGDHMSDPTISATQIASTCKSINGNAYNDYFKTQIWNTVYGTSDYLVKPTNNVRNADGTCVLYGMGSSGCSGVETFSVSGGGSGKQYRDANGKLRVSDISVSGMSHAWPAGSGGSGGGTYVDYTRINYPAWITDWFFKNNLRLVTMAAPANLVVTGATDNTITLSWGAVSGAAGYNVYRDGARAGSPTGTGFTDSGLNPGSSYNYVVKAVANNSEGAASSVVQGTTTGTPPVLGAPSGLAGTPSATAVVLQWNVVSGAKSYKVYRNGAVVGNPTGNTFTDNGLANNTIYSYAVSSVNNANAEGAKSAAISVATNNAYSDTKTDTLTNHYVAGRLSLNAYLGLGKKLGYTASVTLYNCGGSWTDQANCTPLSY
ncbi:MAG: PHB depolymerase family esterase [Betaproteobacteria bacterium]